MTLRTIAKSSSIFTDEIFTESDIISIANRCIARINTECRTLFPFYKSMGENYEAIPEMWQLDLLSPYISYGIKMNDSSLTEANMYLDEFYRALEDFSNSLGTLVNSYEKGDIKGGISPDFINKEGFGGVYGIDTSNAINVGFFGSNGNGGSF